jgi:outer membrane receptor protein involved in Fe transport
MKKCTLLLFFLALVSSQMLMAQVRQLAGTVKDSRGVTMPGVTVVQKGTTNGTVTDPSGQYRLTLLPNANTIEFRFVGMKTVEVPIDNKTTIDVVMQEEALTLGGIVVTAIGIPREEKALGYAVQEVSGEDISNAMNTNMINSLNGKVAGVQIVNSSGVAGASTYITIRGINSITGDNQPLFVVDGVPIDNSIDYSGNTDDAQNNLGEGVAYSITVSLTLIPMTLHRFPC